MEGVHGGVVVRRERNVARRRSILSHTDGELRAAAWAERNHALDLERDAVAERRERLLVELPAPVEIRDVERDVVDHHHSSRR